MQFEVSPHAAPERKAKEARIEQPLTPEQREREAGDREAILAELKKGDMSPDSAFRFLATYGSKLEGKSEKEFESLVESYGIDSKKLPETDRRLLESLYGGMNGTKSDESKAELAGRLEQSIRERLTRSAFENLDQLRDAVTNVGSFEEMKGKLQTLMGSMSRMAKQVSPEETGNADAWSKLYKEFTSLSSLKGKGPEQMQKIFSEVFHEYQEFIENEFVAREDARLAKQGKGVNSEKLMQEVFGISKEESEKIKTENRKKVAEFIEAHKDEPVTIELIEQLHQINNDRIVPRFESKIRKEGNISFGKRFGIIGADVREELEDFEARATLESTKRTPKAIYEIAVAKLHNDLLDIHPFPDRNGSTSLLFVEFMMAKKGYEPPEKRDSDYYAKLRKMLGNNPVALGVVGHQHWKIANAPGYYEGKTTTRGKRPKQYEKALGILKQREEAKKANKSLS